MRGDTLHDRIKRLFGASGVLRIDVYFNTNRKPRMYYRLGESRLTIRGRPETIDIASEGASLETVFWKVERRKE